MQKALKVLPFGKSLKSLDDAWFKGNGNKINEAWSFVTTNLSAHDRVKPNNCQHIWKNGHNCVFPLQYRELCHQQTALLKNW